MLEWASARSDTRQGPGAVRTGRAAVWGRPQGASERGEGSEETSLAGAEWDSAAAGGSVTGGGGCHPVEDEGAGAEDARVALP